jgi:hypothetical protein
MKCGNCKDSHETVAEVRECYASRPVGKFLEGDQASLAQIDFLNKLRSERGLELYFRGTKEKNYADRERLGKHAASVEIDQLKRTPVQPKDDVIFSADGGEFTITHRPVAPKQVLEGGASKIDVPEGHYAIRSLSGNNDLDFYAVDKPSEGKWKGYTFVNRIVGGHDPIRIRKSRDITKILRAIEAAGVTESAQLYAAETGNCYKCNRHLTDYASRSLGIGPVCAEQKGLGGEWNRIRAEFEAASRADAAEAATPRPQPVSFSIPHIRFRAPRAS